MVISPDEFPFGWFYRIPKLKRSRGNQGSKEKFYYKDLITCFDIETSRIPQTHWTTDRILPGGRREPIDHYQTAMYMWQWQIGAIYTVVGRTMQELREFVNKLQSYIKGNLRLVVFVHNLSYEFQFLRSIFDWQTEDVFATKSRKVLRAYSPGRKLEYRCSYMHSNMSLAQYTHKMGVKHQKLSGDDFDYHEIRYPWTPLTKEQLEYGVNDVLGLYEAITKEMEMDGDTLYTFPLTSTGYLRREVKEALAPIRQKVIRPMMPTLLQYNLLREAFAGGDTHANRYYTGQIIENVHSWDRSSSYPDVQCNEKFPIRPFVEIGHTMGLEEYTHLTKKLGKAVVSRCRLVNLRLKNPHFGCPYFSKSKCRGIINGTFDNGRVMSADYLEISITEIDWLIVEEEYTWDVVEFADGIMAGKGYLPKQFTDIIKTYYHKKTDLKDVEGQEVYYMKSKNKLNSGYGMTAQDIGKQMTLFVDGEFVEDEQPIAEIVEKAAKKAFIPYQWGVYTTAYARLRLHEAIWLVGDGYIYSDTDSVKFIGDVDFTAYNKLRREASRSSGAYATDPQGVTHYMGVYEQERGYDRFRTWGAKKYASEKDGKVEVTVSGVNKKRGRTYLSAHGGLKSFTIGFNFAACSTASEYNDTPPEPVLEIEGHALEIGPNILIKDDDYTLGITAEYAALLSW